VEFSQTHLLTPNKDKREIHKARSKNEKAKTTAKNSRGEAIPT